MRIAQRMAVAVTVLSLTLGIAGPAFANSPTFSQAPFTDIKAGSTYYDAVEYLRLNNLVKGYMDGTFGPDLRMTRAEFVTLMTNPFLLKQTRATDCNNMSASGTALMVDSVSMVAPYTDVPTSAWYARAVCVATLYHVVNGYPDGTFRPNQSITFVEAAKMASTILQLSAEHSNPTDPRWFTVYVQNLSDHNAIPTTIKRLDQVLTRGQIAEIVYRLSDANTSKASLHWANFANQ